MTNEAWKRIFEDFDISYRQRRGPSQALMALCIFHDEKTPSLRAYPSGNFQCFGCGAEGTRDDFTPELKIAVEGFRAAQIQKQADWDRLMAEDATQQLAAGSIEDLPS